MLLTMHAAMAHHTIGDRLDCRDCSLSRVYTALSSNGGSWGNRSAFQSCYSHSCLLTGNGTTPIACPSHGHVDTPLRHTAHGSRPRGAREGCVADGEAMVSEHLSGPARGLSRVVS